MTDFSDARARAHAAGIGVPRKTELVSLDAAHGRTLATAVTATANLPGFDSAAMDGWVVNGDGPWMLGQPIKAGDDIPTEPLPPGAARPISTGAPLPPGATRVIRSERGAVDGHLVETDTDHGQHIRRAGEEAPVGSLLLEDGLRLTPPRIALAAAAGYDELSVVAPAGVRLLVLGDEVVDHGHPVPGHVRDVFTPSLPPLLGELGTLTLGRVGDSLDDTVSALAAATEPLLVTTGGSSRGTSDHVRAALAALEAEVLLDGVRMRPGHPLLLARLGSGALVLCLPGNPLAAFVGLLAIGGALVDGILGRPVAPLERAALAQAIPGGPSTRVTPATRTPEGVMPTSLDGAGMLRGLASADLLAVIPPSGASAGERVDCLPLPW